jgi:hypothetical protein
MDPLSIAAAAAGLFNLCTKILGYIYKVGEMRTVGDILKILAGEIELVSAVLDSIDKSFRGPLLKATASDSHKEHEAEHWESVTRSLNGCREVLQSLNAIIETINSPKRGILHLPKRMLTWKIKLREIALLREQVACHREKMKFSLIFIVAYFTLTPMSS